LIINVYLIFITKIKLIIVITFNKKNFPTCKHLTFVFFFLYVNKTNIIISQCFVSVLFLRHGPLLNNTQHKQLSYKCLHFAFVEETEKLQFIAVSYLLPNEKMYENSVLSFCFLFLQPI